MEIQELFSPVSVKDSLILQLPGLELEDFLWELLHENQIQSFYWSGTDICYIQILESIFAPVGIMLEKIHQ